MAGFTLYPKRKIKKLLRDGEYDEAIAFGKSLEEKFAEDHDFMFIMQKKHFRILKKRLNLTKEMLKH